MKKTTVFMIILQIACAGFSYSDALTVSYIERPPYYYTDQRRATGFLLEKVRKIFLDAGIAVTFQVRPPNRVIHEIKRGGDNCSVGWFKTLEREQFAKFSLPIYRNSPIVILTVKQQQHRFSPYRSLGEVFADQTLVMASIGAFSYGAYIDQLIEATSPRLQRISTRQTILPKLILSGRANYMLVAPEEIETLLDSADLNPKDFVAIKMSDIPDGNRRYIICSKEVSDNIIGKLNFSIKENERGKVVSPVQPN